MCPFRGYSRPLSYTLSNPLIPTYMLRTRHDFSHPPTPSHPSFINSQEPLMKKAGAQIGSSLWRPIFTHPYFSTALSRLPFDGNSGILTHIGEIFVSRTASLWSRDEVCCEAVLICTTTPIRTLIIMPILTHPLSGLWCTAG